MVHRGALGVLHSVFDIGIVDFWIAAIGLEIACHLQPAAELQHSGMVHARAQFNRRQLRPSALRDELGILLYGRFGGRDVLFRESRQKLRSGCVSQSLVKVRSRVG